MKLLQYGMPYMVIANISIELGGHILGVIWSGNMVMGWPAIFLVEVLPKRTGRRYFGEPSICLHQSTRGVPCSV